MIVVQQIRTADHQAADPLLEKLRIDFHSSRDSCVDEEKHAGDSISIYERTSGIGFQPVNERRCQIG